MSVISFKVMPYQMNCKNYDDNKTNRNNFVTVYAHFAFIVIQHFEITCSSVFPRLSVTPIQSTFSACFMPFLNVLKKH